MKVSPKGKERKRRCAKDILGPFGSLSILIIITTTWSSWVVFFSVNLAMACEECPRKKKKFPSSDYRRPDWLDWAGTVDKLINYWFVCLFPVRARLISHGRTCPLDSAIHCNLPAHFEWFFLSSLWTLLTFSMAREHGLGGGGGWESKLKSLCNSLWSRSWFSLDKSWFIDWVQWKGRERECWLAIARPRHFDSIRWRKESKKGEKAKENHWFSRWWKVART